MIPKIIHYCWMSGEEYPELVKKCIKSWKTVLHDYKIIEWNSDNFNYNCNRYAYEAYVNKKWAFVSDYVRLKVLYDYGGIYLDSDIEVFKKFDNLLNNKAFTGFENNEIIGPWLLASEPHNRLFSMLLKEYDNRSFVLPNGELDLTPNPIILTKPLKDIGFKNNGCTQYLNDITIYPKDYFCPKDFTTGNIDITENTYCIHYFNGGWLPLSYRLKHSIIKNLIYYLGAKNTNLIKYIYNICKRKR